MMPRATRVGAIVLLSLCWGSALAGPSISILSPKDGAKLDSMAQNTLRYRTADFPPGARVTVYMDGTEVSILPPDRGSYIMETLAPGRHRICVKAIDKTEHAIAPPRCIHLDVH